MSASPATFSMSAGAGASRENRQLTDGCSYSYSGHCQCINIGQQYSRWFEVVFASLKQGWSGTEQSLVTEGSLDTDNHISERTSTVQMYMYVCYNYAIDGVRRTIVGPSLYIWPAQITQSYAGDCPSNLEQLVGLYGFMLLCIWYGSFPIQWTKEAGEQSESGKRTTPTPYIV